MHHINSPMQVIDAAEGRGLVEVTTHKARATLSLVEPQLEAEKGAQYNLRELQALLHEADMTATVTTIRYVYLLSFRKNVSYLQFACFCIKHGALSVDYVIRFWELTIKWICVGLVSAKCVSIMFNVSLSLYDLI